MYPGPISQFVFIILDPFEFANACKLKYSYN